MKEKILSYINREKELYEGEKLCLSKCVNEHIHLRYGK